MKWNSLRKTYMHTWLRAPTTCKATLEILSLNFSKSISWTEMRISQVSSILILYWFPVIFQIFHGLLPIFQICMSFCHYLVVITYFTAIITWSFQIIAWFYFINIRQWYWFFFNCPGNSYFTCQYMGPCSCYNITHYYINVAFHCMGTNAM